MFHVNISVVILCMISSSASRQYMVLIYGCILVKWSVKLRCSSCKIVSASSSQRHTTMVVAYESNKADKSPYALRILVESSAAIISALTVCKL